jgi:hypothetical protein
MHEAGGFLPQRVQAQVAMTHTPYCIVGFSCECGQGCDQVHQAWPFSKSEDKPEPADGASKWVPVAPEPASPSAPSSGGSAHVRAPVARDRHGRIATVTPETERGARSIAERVAHKKVVHRDRLLADQLYGDAETELEYAVQLQWVTIDGDQLRPGPVSVPARPPVPAQHAVTEAISPEVERGAREIVKGIAVVGVMHRDQILRQKLGEVELELEFAAQREWLAIDEQGQVRLGPVAVPVPPPVPARHAGMGSR